MVFHGYGDLSRQRIPSTLSLKKANLGQNASQSKYLMHHIPFILYEFKNCEEYEKVWICIRSMLTILKVIYSSTISETDLILLEEAVSEHLTFIQECFGIKLKPKHHNMTHYANVIRSVGPLVHMSTLRFEMKHKQFKNFVKKSNNFMNLTKSLTIRSQHEKIYKKCYIDEISHAKLKILDNKFFNSYAEFLPANQQTSTIKWVKWLKINSNYYKTGLLIKSDAKYFEIVKILSINNDFFFICIQYSFLNYDAFLSSIEIQRKLPQSIHLIKQSRLAYKKSLKKKTIGEKTFIIADNLEIEKCT